MAIWRIEEMIVPQDIPGFMEAFRAYRADPTLPNPLDEFTENQWRFLEDYDDAPSDDGAPPPLSIKDHLSRITATTGRSVRANAGE